MKNLNAQTIPLSGKHLIEASAGTGKTFNITRIFLRLLLERNIPIDQILVMTFTKDATEELRGRIDEFIREALNHWDELILNDEYFISLSQNVDSQTARVRLQQALLYLDEAAIFTIHGFCKRVLAQHAFTSGLPFNVTMEADCQDLLLEACQDYYRRLSYQAVESFNTLVSFWAHPHSFLQKFSKAIAKNDVIDVIEPITLVDNLVALLQEGEQALQNNHSLFYEALISIKKGAEQEKRQAELAQLTTWLADVKHALLPLIALKGDFTWEDFSTIEIPVMPTAFMDGRRYGRSKLKNELLEAFAPLNKIKSTINAFAQSVHQTFAFIIARRGIYQIRDDFHHKKQKLNLLNFDDLIRTLHDALANDPQGRLAQAIYQQYPVALVDEFQDTDPQQFSLLKAIYFKEQAAALYMIGDPKQAIYGFRGGDVFAYLTAREHCDYQWYMDTNWRSTPAMITGYNRLFYGNKLSDKAKDVFGYNIPYVPVKASPIALAHQPCDKPALNFVHFTHDEPQYLMRGSSGCLKQNFREPMALWCAEEIVRLFQISQIENPNQPLQAQHIAILVRDASEARAIKGALESCNLQSVYMSSRANLLLSEQTSQLLIILKGILFVENERLFSAALTSALLDYPLAKFIALQNDEIAWQGLKFEFIALRDHWIHKGFMSMAIKLMHDHFSLAPEGRDRALTNLLHLFELLQHASQKHREPQALLSWFEQQMSLDNPEIESELRLESDDNLIRIITQHGAKGLEYPIVFVPFATRHKHPLKFGNSEVSFIEYHDSAGQLHLSLDGSSEAKQAMAEEAYAESIRLLYVAVTRAERTCYIGVAPFEDYEKSPLGKTLKWDKDTEISQGLQALAQDEPKAINVLNVAHFQTQSLKFATDNVAVVPIMPQFTGSIERDWWLSSFSALSRNLTSNGLSRPDRDLPVERLDVNTEPSLPVAAQAEQLRFTLTKGAHTGNLLHDILQYCDFTQPQWLSLLPKVFVKYNNVITDHSEAGLQPIMEWLDEILQAPLDNFCLADISRNQSLREREFYFPMEKANTKALLALLAKHRASGDFAEEVQSHHNISLPSINYLKGMMHGFIDLIFCHDEQYFVCDYKSSYLGDNITDYSTLAMHENIETHHYDLQYFIYTLALHRHLSLSLPNYDPQLHLGGVYYLYLRGMHPEYQGAGVYYRKIPIEDILALDKLFSGDVAYV